MSRKARKCNDAPYYHVMVQGINKNNVFHNENDKIMYLKLLKKYSYENNIIIIAYCIMDTHLHLLLKVPDVFSLSRCMKQLNTTFAIHYNKENNRVGYVFRDRFKGEPIYECYYLHNCIKYIHQNPVKAGICRNQIDYAYSTYKKYKNKSWFTSEKLYNEIFATEEEYLNVLDDGKSKFNFIDEEMSIEEARNYLECYLKSIGVEYMGIKLPKEILKSAVKKLKAECRIKNREIAILLKIDEHLVGKILKEDLKNLQKSSVPF